MRTAQLHLQRSTEALLGYLQGITCDDHLSDLEIANLQGWLESHHALRENWPFDEITDRVESILHDSVIDEEERAELLEWCADLSLDTHPAYELIDMATRQLHGVLHGIQSDGEVTEDEVYGLRDWLEHFHIFRGTWPFSDAFALDNTQLNLYTETMNAFAIPLPPFAWKTKFVEILQAHNSVLSGTNALGRASTSLLESPVLLANRGEL